MAEVNKEVTTPEPENKPVQLTPTEERAQHEGWVPKEQWEGDPEEWRPAKEFLDRGELFKKIDEQNRTIKEFKRTLNDFSKHHERVRETEYKRALADLKAEKKAALLDGDADAVVEIDEKMALVREAARPEAQAPAQPQIDPQTNIVFTSWVGRNNWYNSNPAMRAYADKVGNDLGAQGGMSPSDLLRNVEQEVRKQFPERFNNPNRDKPGSVEGGGASKGGKSKDSFELNEVERRAMQRFIRTVPGMTEDKYIADLKKIKGAN